MEGRSLDERIALLKIHGDKTMSYSVLQDGLNYFDTEEGFIAYTQQKFLGNHTIVLGDPIASQNDIPTILQKFTNQADNPFFIQIEEDTGRALENLGYYVNRFGTNTLVDPRLFTTKGSKMEHIRRQTKKATKAGVTVVEQPLRKVSVEDLENISREWIQSRIVKTGELSLLVRPAVHKEEEGVRKLFAYQGNKLVGFAYYDPLFKNGNTIGYFAGINRVAKDAPTGTTYFMDVTMLDKLKEEDKEIFSLGFSPFSKVTDNQPFNHSKVSQWYFNLNFEKMNDLYNYKGQEQRKAKYRGNAVPVFFASEGKYVKPVIELLGLYKACNISIPAQIKQAAQFWKK